jgi:O-antigen/teichoic acid export membrane protein
VLSEGGKARIGATRFLMVTNLAGMGMTFLNGLVVARVLGPERLGVAAIVTGIATSLLAFFDIRLSDVAARAFYQLGDRGPEAARAFRAAVLALAVLGNGLVAAATAVVGWAVGNRVIPFFTGAPVRTWWLPLAAGVTAVNAISATVLFLMRFTGSFFEIGACRLASQAAGLLLTVTVLKVMPDISGSYLASAAGSAFAAALVSLVALRVWGGREGMTLRGADWRGASQEYRRSLGMIFYGNFLGYAKLLQRSADVLLVGLFAGDRETGLYKLARSLVDAVLSVPQDALYQVYYPRLLGAIGLGSPQEYRALSLRMLKVSTLMTLALLAAEAALLPAVVRTALGARFVGVQWPVMILTLTFVFISGFYPWLWSIFNSSGKLRGYTGIVYLSTAVQYAVAVALFALVGASAVTAAVAALAYYLALTPAAYWLARRRRPGFLP